MKILFFWKILQIVYVRTEELKNFLTKSPLKLDVQFFFFFYHFIELQILNLDDERRENRNVFVQRWLTKIVQY